MSKHDAVQNPAHYDLFPGQQVIDIIRATLTPAEFAGYLKGNVLKYRLRAGEKGDAAEDLGKAAKYRSWLYEFRAEGFTPTRGAKSGEFNSGYGAPGQATHWDTAFRTWIAQDTDGGYSEYRQGAWFPVPEAQAKSDWRGGLQPIVR